MNVRRVGLQDDLAQVPPEPSYFEYLGLTLPIFNEKSPLSGSFKNMVRRAIAAPCPTSGFRHGDKGLLKVRKLQAVARAAMNSESSGGVVVSSDCAKFVRVGDIKKLILSVQDAGEYKKVGVSPPLLHLYLLACKLESEAFRVVVPVPSSFRGCWNLVARKQHGLSLFGCRTE